MTKKERRAEKTYNSLVEHIEKYPSLLAEDLFKFIFQSSFGCEHLLSSESTALERIRSEYETVDRTERGRVEALDGDYARVHLSVLNDGLLPETLARLFCLSAKTEETGEVALCEKIDVLCTLAKDGVLPFSTEELCDKLEWWRERGYPAVHHSESFRASYRPSYRVIARKYAELLPLFVEIDKRRTKENITIAVEGGSASGKSTLSEILGQVYDCRVFHMDDFFLRPHQRNEERLREVGGNIDRERFAEEILPPLVRGERVQYRRFDCSTQSLGEYLCVESAPLSVVEGVYSMHPYFGRYYELSVFLDIDSECQRRRIYRRNSEDFAVRFFEEWIPLEEIYFEETKILERADMVIKVKD